MTALTRQIHRNGIAAPLIVCRAQSGEMSPENGHLRAAVALRLTEVPIVSLTCENVAGDGSEQPRSSPGRAKLSGLSSKSLLKNRP